MSLRFLPVIARASALVLLVTAAPRALIAQAAPALDSQSLAALRLRTIGPATMSGRITDLAVVESNPYTFYVASATGGLWKTTDNGVTFAPVFERERVHSIGAVAVHQGTPSVVWVGSGEATNRQSSSWGDGVYKSTDGGASWTNMGLADTHHVGRIVLHPTDVNTVYVAAAGHLWGPNAERGVYKSVDGGTTWARSLFIDENTGVIDLAMDPSDPNTLYAAAYQRQRKAWGFHGGGPGSGLYKSTDAGATWRRLTNGLPEGEAGRIAISVYRKDPRVVYVSVEQGLRYTASVSYAKRLGGLYRSDDKGEHWRFMSDWNPRPAYSSQLRVDPSDVSRIYMVAYSYSSDSGKTFVAPRTTTHGDDRVVWVDPHDSRHLLKGDDGGLAISYDRGVKWLYVTSLPVSQLYRLSVDMRTPYWVYGGLQDNGSWAGPSATYLTSGVLNEDWVRTNGGDGFFNVIDTTDNRTLYTNGQYLTLYRFDMQTLQAKPIRPVNKEGEAPKRGNWGAPEPLVGKYTAPANWDAPFIISPHDHRTLYAGMRVLWKSTDRGEHWTSLGDLTTHVARRSLPIMGQMPVETTPSLDDGVPYYPTTSALAESPRTRGELWVGTDDGNVQRSVDGGRTWQDRTGRFPGLPKGTWVAGLEPSRHRAGVVYAAFDGHRTDDYANYLYKSSDGGTTWASITGDLPAGRVLHAIHEDPKNPDLLYAGTEFGFFFSTDGGAHWTELRNNMPRLAINDFVIHPRENDLVLATHGRGVWILDDLAPLQQLTAAVRSSASHLFTVRAATMIRYASTKAHTGDMIFRGENPPAGAIVDYWLREAGADVALSIHDAKGALVATLAPTTTRGMNRVIWNLRYPSLPAGAPSEDEDERRPAAPLGPWAEPGTYTVRLTAGGVTSEQRVTVREDPRLSTISAAERRAWSEATHAAARMYVAASALAERATRVAADSTRGSASEARAEAHTLALTTAELQSRVGALYAALMQSTSAPTADLRAQMTYFPGLTATLEERVRRLEAAR